MEFLNQLIESITTQFGTLVPGLIGAILTLIIGFFLAGLVRRLTKRLLGKTNLDEKLQSSIKTNIRMDDFIAKLAYYLVILLTLLVVLNLLGVDGVLTPLQNMVDKFIDFIPNIIGAGIIAYAGYFIAHIASEATGFIAHRLENYANSQGIKTGEGMISKTIKQLVFFIVLVPLVIIALDTLNMTAISAPATEMLSNLMQAIPLILAAALIMAVFYIVGKIVTSFVSDLLQNIGLDKITEQLKLQSILGNISLSKLVGNIMFFFIMFSGIIAAVDKLDFEQMSIILNQILTISGRIFFGLVILLVGLFISKLAIETFLKNNSDKWMIPIVRFTILGIFFAFSLHTMGIAESIVNLAFGLTLGAIAVAFALSFGLGGREAAGKQMQRFFDKINNNK